MVKSRRRIILSLVFSAPFFSGIWLWRESWSSPAAASLRPLLKSRLRDVFTDLDAARDVGRHYLAVCPEETRLVRLTEGLLTGEALKNFEAFVERIAELRVRDFENNDTVIVDGWVLARSEARVCALVCQI